MTEPMEWERNGKSASPARFSHYLDTHSLPIATASVRPCSDGRLMALVEHAPSDGLLFEPIDDLVVSIVMKSVQTKVIRDIGWGRQEFTEAAGCILVTPPNCRSYWHFEGAPMGLHISVPSDRIPDWLGIDRSQLAEYPRGPIYDQLVSQLVGRMWNANAGAPRAAAFVDHALGVILNLVLAPEASAAARSAPALASWRLNKVMALMNERLRAGVSIEELARAIELSPDHFLRSFTVATGRTPFQWLTERRIEVAKELLQRHDMQITDIALDVGYSSSAHFSTRFRKLVGMSPREWRATFLN